MGYGRGEQTTTIQGVQLALPGGDSSMVPSLVGGYHEALELEIFTRLSAGASLVADVGGNVGLYACAGGVIVKCCGWAG
jgi:hypothetical protein